MACIHWELTPGDYCNCNLLDRPCPCQGEAILCPDLGGMMETRHEGLMKQAARLLAAAGGYRFRHYVVKVDSGRAMCIEEFDPPRPKKLVL